MFKKVLTSEPKATCQQVDLNTTCESSDTRHALFICETMSRKINPRK